MTNKHRVKAQIIGLVRNGLIDDADELFSKSKLTEDEYSSATQIGMNLLMQDELADRGERCNAQGAPH